ncbi:MAG: PQQ-binding-like beta-propeller repeat protein [Planctomycetaceae bacterium]
MRWLLDSPRSDLRYVIRKAYVLMLSVCVSSLGVLYTGMTPTGAQVKERRVETNVLLPEDVLGPAPAIEQVDQDGLNPLLSQPGFKVPFDDRLLSMLDDVERYIEHAEWEKAFRQITEISDEKMSGMVPTEWGFMVPARQRIWRILANLPAEGRETFRLYYNGPADELMSGIDQLSLTDQKKMIEAATKVYDQYFLSSQGDEAADLLGDLAFEQGKFLEADAYWKAILDYHPQSEISESLLWVKRATAIARTGRRAEFDDILVQVGNRLDGETVSIGGRSATVKEIIEELNRSVSVPVVTPVDELSIAAPADGSMPEWRIEFLASEAQLEIRRALENMGWGGDRLKLDTYVPPIAMDEQNLYCQWFGIVFAIDLSTGKLKWKTNDFAGIKGEQFQQLMYRMTPGRYQIKVVGDQVLVIGVTFDEMSNWNAPSRIWSLDAATGKKRWDSAAESTLSSYHIVGDMLIRGDTALILAHQEGSGEMKLAAIQLEDGKHVWNFPVGTMQMMTNVWGQSVVPSPQLFSYGDKLYVLTNNGALLLVDENNRRIEWLLRSATPNGLEGQPDYQQQESPAFKLHSAGSLYERDKVLYFKEGRSRKCYALDLETESLTWQRPIEEETMIVGVDAENVYLLSDELEAIDRKTRSLKWSVALPVEGGGLSCIIGDDRILVQTARGTYEISKVNGDPLRIFRGYDTSCMGGLLTVREGLLIHVANDAITAYPLPTRDTETETE